MPCSTVRRGNDFRLRKDRKSTRLNSSHSQISYAVFCLTKTKVTRHRCRLSGPLIDLIVLLLGVLRPSAHHLAPASVTTTPAALERVFAARERTSYRPVV